MTQLNVLSKEVPQKIAGMSLTAKAIFEEWASRTKFRRKNNLTILRNKVLQKLEDKFNDKDFEAAIKQLEQDTRGSIHYGRNGDDNYLVINYSLKDLGTAVVSPDKMGEIHQLGDKPVVVKAKRQAKTKKRRNKRLGRPVGSKNRQVSATPVVETPRMASQVIIFIPGKDGPRPMEFSSVKEALAIAEYIKLAASKMVA